MLFNTFQFILFFAFVLVTYKAAPKNRRNSVLLGASLIFYTLWIPSYLVLLLVDLWVNYALMRAMVVSDASPSGTRRSSQRSRSRFAEGSAFSWIVRLADVCGMKTVHSPSRTPTCATASVTSRVISCSPRPETLISIRRVRLTLARRQLEPARDRAGRARSRSGSSRAARSNRS